MCDDYAMSPNDDPIALKCPQCGADLIPGSGEYIICQYCGSSLLWRGHSQESQPGQLEPAVLRGMRLKKFTYTDREGTGLDMFSMLAPDGWQMQGGCRWLLDNPGMPAAISIQLYNPQGLEAFEILPNTNFTWNDNPMTRMMFPPGSRYFGAEVRPLAGIHEAFRAYVLPRFRGSLPELQILKEEPLPDLPARMKSEALIGGGAAEGGRVRIRYRLPAGMVDEEIYGVVESVRIPYPTMFGYTELVLWNTAYLFSFRTAAGRLEAMEKLFNVMIHSFQLNPHWYAAYKSLIHALTQQQIQHIHHIGQISRIIAQTSEQIRQQNLNDWYARQATYDRLSTDWSRSIRGVDGYYDPHSEQLVELPGGYDQAWANPLGEYIITEDPNFNPNIGSNLHWEPMQRQ